MEEEKKKKEDSFSPHSFTTSNTNVFAPGGAVEVCGVCVCVSWLRGRRWRRIVCVSVCLGASSKIDEGAEVSPLPRLSFVVKVGKVFEVCVCV